MIRMRMNDEEARTGGEGVVGGVGGSCEKEDEE